MKLIRIIPLFICAVLLFSCGEGWEGKYKKEGEYSVKMPNKPSVSDIESNFLFGTVKFEKATCRVSEESDVQFTVLHGSMPEISKEDLKGVLTSELSTEDYYFKRNAEADDAENLVLSSFDLIRNELKDKELMVVRNLDCQGHPAKSYALGNSKENYVKRFDVYWVENRIFILIASGTATTANYQQMEKFFDSFEIFNLKRKDFSDAKPQVGIDEEELSDVEFPSIDYLITAQHRYKAREEKAVLETDFGKASMIVKSSYPRKNADPNRVYLHGVIDFQRNLLEIDSFQQEIFFDQIAEDFVRNTGAEILEKGDAVLGGHNGFEIRGKSRTGSEYTHSKFVITGRYFYLTHVVSNINNKNSDYKKKFFRSVRIRKEEDLVRNF